MKKTLLFAFAMSASVLSNAQLKMNSDGNIGIGTYSPWDSRLEVSGKNRDFNLSLTGEPTEANLNIESDNPRIRFTNGNYHTFELTNYIKSPWDSPNTLAILDKTDNKLLMEFRPEGTFIHNDFFVGVGKCSQYAGTTARQKDAKGYVFNPKLNSGNDGFIIERISDYRVSNNESAGIYFDSDIAAIWSAGDGYLLQVIDEDGMQIKWYIDGSGQAFTNSDKNRKEDIVNIEGGLSKVLRLNGVNYRFRMTDEEYEKSAQLSVKNSNSDSDVNAKNPMTSGFIAQDLEKVIPEVVQTDANGDKFVNYDAVVPYLVEGIKEQQTEIESLSNKIQEQQAENEFLSNEIQDLKVMIYELSVKMGELSGNNSISEAFTGNLLYQNTPNPCSEITTIKYHLSSKAKSAVIKVVDVNGRTLKSYDLQVKEEGELLIDAKEFAAGNYTYSLYVDEQLVDSKQMILTE